MRSTEKQEYHASYCSPIYRFQNDTNKITSYLEGIGKLICSNKIATIRLNIKVCRVFDFLCIAHTVIYYDIEQEAEKHVNINYRLICFSLGLYFAKWDSITETVPFYGHCLEDVRFMFI